MEKNFNNYLKKYRFKNLYNNSFIDELYYKRKTFLFRTLNDAQEFMNGRSYVYPVLDITTNIIYYAKPK